MRKNNFHIISVDLSTSSVRASLVNPSLEILTQSQKPVALMTGADGTAEQDTDEIIAAAIACINEVVRVAQASNYNQLAVCFSNAMASLVCLNGDYQPIQPALTYMDLRGSQESDELLASYGGEFFRRTATPMHASYWLPKFLWMNKLGLINHSCRYFCTIKDLLVYQLTGHFVTDYSNAVATGMCDVTKGDWDERLLELAGITKAQLPAILPTTSTLAPKNGYSPPLTHRSIDFYYVLGAMDGVLSSLGASAYNPGQVTTAIGSSGACRIAARSPLTEPGGYGIWSYPLDEDIWFRGGAMNNGGLVTQWLAETFSKDRRANDDGYQDLFDQAAQVQPGSDGLIFLPYLYGERAPIYNEHARGVFFGINPGHTRGHLARAGLEGILFAMYSIFNALHKNSPGVLEIWGTGGYVRSDLMLQIQADIFGKPIHITHTPEGSTIGAAMLAYKALKQIDSYDELSDHISTERIIYPNHTAHKTYQEIFPVFIDLYQQLKPLLDRAKQHPLHKP